MLLAKRALALTVPVVVSTWLSSDENTPLSSTLERVRSSAVTFMVLPATADCCNSPAMSCGTANTTSTGLIWVIKTMPLASLLLTTLPTSTVRKPTRPLMGATTRA